MPYCDVNGVRLFYKEVGQGLPCLLMHGGLGVDHTHLHPWLDPLGDVLRLVYYDHRGNGRSGAPVPPTWTHADLIADAEALRQKFGLGRIVLLGHSYGGFLALEYALRYPDSLSHLILSSTAPAVDYWEELRANMRARGATEAMIASFEPGSWSTDEGLRKNIKEKVGWLNFGRGHEHLCEPVFRETIYSAAARERCFQLIRTYDVTTRLGEIRVPTLILVGAEDVFTPTSQAKRLHAGIQGSELVEIQGSGHFVYAECPDVFFPAVRSWLARH